MCQQQQTSTFNIKRWCSTSTPTTTTTTAKNTTTTTTTTATTTMTTTTGQGKEMTEGDGKGSGSDQGTDQGSRRDVSSPGMFLLFFPCLFYWLIFFSSYLYTNCVTWMKMGEATAKTGPNDVSRVVWAFSKFFLFAFVFFLMLTYVLLQCRLANYEIYDREREGTRRRRDRAQTTCFASFGPLMSAFFLYIHIFL